MTPGGGSGNSVMPPWRRAGITCRSSSCGSSQRCARSSPPLLSPVSSPPIAAVAPGSRSFLKSSGNRTSRGDRSLASRIHLSFRALTTGDQGGIGPMHPLARSVCNVEAIIGQHYAATLSDAGFAMSAAIASGAVDRVNLYRGMSCHASRRGPPIMAEDPPEISRAQERTAGSILTLAGSETEIETQLVIDRLLRACFALKIAAGVSTTSPPLAPFCAIPRSDHNFYFPKIGLCRRAKQEFIGRWFDQGEGASPMADEVQSTSELSKIAKLNGDFKRNYGALLGALLYLRSISAARGRSWFWGGLLSFVGSIALGWLAWHGWTPAPSF